MNITDAAVRLKTLKSFLETAQLSINAGLVRMQENPTQASTQFAYRFATAHDVAKLTQVIARMEEKNVEPASILYSVISDSLQELLAAQLMDSTSLASNANGIHVNRFYCTLLRAINVRADDLAVRYVGVYSK